MNVTLNKGGEYVDYFRFQSRGRTERLDRGSDTATFWQRSRGGQVEDFRTIEFAVSSREFALRVNGMEEFRKKLEGEVDTVHAKIVGSLRTDRAPARIEIRNLTIKRTE